MDYVPEDKVFQIPPASVMKQQGGYDVGIPSELSRSKDGEMLSIFPGFPLPRKGVIYSEAIIANNHVKRVSLALFLPLISKAMILPFVVFLFTPYKWKLQFAEKFLHNYIRLAWSFYAACVRVPVLEKEYYSNLSRGLWDIVVVFLTDLGFSEYTALEMGKIVATTFEYDDRYKLMVLDPMQEFSKDEILMNPRRAIDKFIRIMKQRTNTWNFTTNLNENRGQDFKKIEAAAKVLKLALYIPKVRKAFNKALEGVTFRFLQLDELERFWNLNRADYDTDGRSYPERNQEWQYRMNQFNNVPIQGSNS